MNGQDHQENKTNSKGWMPFLPSRLPLDWAFIPPVAQEHPQLRKAILSNSKHPPCESPAFRSLVCTKSLKGQGPYPSSGLVCWAIPAPQPLGSGFAVLALQPNPTSLTLPQECILRALLSILPPPLRVCLPENITCHCKWDHKTAT